MATRPSTYLNWTDGSPSKVVQPPSNFLLTGWQAGQAPPFQYANWQIWLADQWIQYLDQQVSSGTPNEAIRLINGGTWSFNATTGALAWSATANLAIVGVPDSANAFNAGSVTLNDGDIAYLTPNSPFYSTGTTNTGNPNSITNMAFTGDLSIGMVVTGPGIPGGTTITGVSPTSVSISNAVTSNNVNATYVFVANGPLTVMTAPNTSVVPTAGIILLARRAGNTIYLGVNCAQMVLRDEEFKTLNGSGYFSVYNAPAGQNLTQGQVVYISAGGADGGRTAGALYPLDCSVSGSAFRATFAGVVITSVTTGQTATVVYEGFYPEVSLIAGDVYYADPTTPGGIVSTPPSGAGQKIVPVGFAVTATSLLIAGAQQSVQVSYPIINDSIIGVGNGSITVFTLPSAPYSNNSVFLFKSGLKVLPADAGVSGTTVTFAVAPGVGEVIEAQFVLASQSYLRSIDELAVDSGDHQNFNISFNPISASAVFVWVGGVKQTPDLFNIVLGAQPAVRLNSPVAVGVGVDVGYFY